MKNKDTSGIELLAPARDLECGRTAILCGADAVYIGAPLFSARQAAGNSVEDIIELTDFAHQFHARVYVALNTLLYDDEVPAACDLIEEFYDARIDGVIIQDVGLLECKLPPITLIASTQMQNESLERIKFLQQVGFKRAILARECSLADIRTIHQAVPDMELECFVHGALCVGYSGRCYLSYAFGSRSSNRGVCAQPCRLKYELQDAGGHVLGPSKHYLSLKDMNRTANLGALLDAGITSFKIEGRLKDQAYVANVVTWYRQHLDVLLQERALKRSSSGVSSINIEPDVKKTFNRGYTTYFLADADAHMGSLDTPKMRGECIGVIQAVDYRSISLDAATDLRSGDGICFLNEEGLLCGTTVNGVDGRSICLNSMEHLKPGMDIFRNHDHAFLTALRKAEPARWILVSMSVEEHPDGLYVMAKDEDGLSAQVRLDIEVVEPAKNPEKAIQTIQKQLGKTGNTIFKAIDVSCTCSPMPFIPVSILNEARRQVLEDLVDKRVEAHSQPDQPRPPADDVKLTEELTFEANILNSNAMEFWAKRGVPVIERAAESGLDMTGRRVMNTRYCLRKELGMCPKRKQRPPDPLYLVDETGRKIELQFTCSACGMELFLCP